MSDVNRRFLAYAAMVICAAVVGLGVSLARTGLTISLVFMVFALFMLFSEGLAVTLPLGNMSLAHPLSVAAAAFLGPGYAALLAALSQVPSLFGRKRVPPVKVAFNASQLALATLAAGWAYLATGGRLLSEGPITAAELPGLIVPIVLVASVGVVLNFALAGQAVHLLQGVPLSRIWRDHFAVITPTQVALGLVGVTMAQVVAAVGVVGLLLFIVPLLVARSTYHRYAEVNQAYADTVRSLVAAIEAKDPYTKGHSVRVAQYTVAIAQRLGLDERAVARIEYAALLHDLGKVGVNRAILAKTGRLTDAEYDEIRRHPEIGAHIIDSVPYLEDIVPVVRHHHERCDGLGYPQGVQGTQIPLPARIMAVADAYDAMTSQRPYRAALDLAHARQEIIDGAGTQFDADVVSAFLAELDAGQPSAEAEAPYSEVLSSA